MGNLFGRRSMKALHQRSDTRLDCGSKWSNVGTRNIGMISMCRDKIISSETFDELPQESAMIEMYYMDKL